MAHRIPSPTQSVNESLLKLCLELTAHCWSFHIHSGVFQPVFFQKCGSLNKERNLGDTGVPSYLLEQWFFSKFGWLKRVSDGLQRWPCTKTNVLLSGFLSPELPVLIKVGVAKKLEVSIDVYASKVAIVHSRGHEKVGTLEMSIIVVTCTSIQQCCERTPNFMCLPFKNAHVI